MYTIKSPNRRVGLTRNRITTADKGKFRNGYSSFMDRDELPEHTGCYDTEANKRDWEDLKRKMSHCNS